MSVENLENEIWKDIKGYEKLYQVSNMGRIKSYPRIKGCIYFDEMILNLHDNGKQYLYIDLYNNNKKKKYYIHRLVAEAFINNPNNLPEINHKDEDRYNNFANNLEWCTHKYNLNYGNHNLKQSLSKKGKRTGKDNASSIKVICLTTRKIFDSISKAKKYYNLPNQSSSISRCCKNKLKYTGRLSDGTQLKWMYYDDYLKQQIDN